MACYHPLYAMVTGLTDKGKKAIRIYSAIELPNFKRAHPEIKEWLTIPCGKCIGCRLDYSREWATRCMLEAKQYEHNQFITLTYDNDNLITNTGTDSVTGEVTEYATLVPDDLAKFIKDLRRYFEYHYNHTGIRFYACGEYGEKYQRPHYHLILFNLPLPDKVPFFKNANGDQIYTSDIIQSIWDRGLTSIGEVTWNSAAYTARYVMKKVKGPTAKEWYSARNILPEFVRMSRKPGIAFGYYEENKYRIYENDEIILTNKKGKGEVVKPSKYFDRLFDLDSPEAMQAIKKKRQEMAINAMDCQLANTSLNKEEYLKLKENNKEESIKRLKRVI